MGERVCAYARRQHACPTQYAHALLYACMNAMYAKRCKTTTHLFLWRDLTGRQGARVRVYKYPHRCIHTYIWIHTNTHTYMLAYTSTQTHTRTCLHTHLIRKKCINMISAIESVNDLVEAHGRLFITGMNPKNCLHKWPCTYQVAMYVHQEPSAYEV